MKHDLQLHINNLYATFPAAKRQPIIGISTNYMNGDAALRDVYYKQIVKAGGTPLLIPPVADKDVLINTLEHIDGLLLTGGGDINPLWAGEEPSRNLTGINAERDLAELMLTRLAFNRQIPILGICRGIQVLAMALGGSVQQDIYESYIPESLPNNTQAEDKTPSATHYRPATIKHSQEAARSEVSHSISISANSILHQLYQGTTLFVNSFHHQAVKLPGHHFTATAWSPDGVIEAMESNEFKPIMGVQWHPEWLGDDGQPLFIWLIDKALAFAKAKDIHKQVLTLDTHCDTPMFFPQGVRFDQRDPRILYDLHKMTEGHQDAVTMAAYLPQPKLGETFSSKIDIEGLKRFNPDLTSTLDHISPAAYADLIFDKIENIVKKNQRYLSIARTPADLYEDKRKGRKSIMFAIENGLALEHQLENVKHFAQRGVTYITLCHNGDNDICDSARGCNTHNGVSAFGEQVIKEMNRNGIMVDLSHGGEKSFYDALDISSQPIVCSHSNSKVLCDVPRNLTDEQMRALAQKGGVAHITLYHGFLKKEGEATILDAIEHLEHAIKIMGIDHVGVGTDFDGDGTVRGMADASEMINFTLQLLRRKYSERDIEKIWGGNWLRVMSQVQRSRQ